MMSEKDSSMGNVQNRVPKLRFPGFDGEWEERKLGDITSKVNSGKTPLGGSSVYVLAGVTFIRSQNVTNDRLELNDSVYISEEVNATMKNSLVKPNDILLNITGASLGRSCVVPDDFTTGNVNQHVCIIRLKENYHAKFIQPIFSSKKGQLIFESLQTGSGREGLNFDSIKKIKLQIPKSDEQQKIASFLSFLNNRIDTQSKIIGELMTFKTIASQKIFSQKFKFKDGNGSFFPAWEIKKLKDVSDVNPKSNGIPNAFYYIDLESVEGGRLLKETRISRFEAPSRAQRVLKRNDVLFQMVRPYQKNNLFFEKEGEYVASTGYAQIRAKQNAQFIYQYLHDQKFVDKVIERCTGTSYPAISANDLGNIIISFPSHAEQIKIANFLSSIDKKVELEKKILNNYYVQKQHLLKILFI